MVLFVFVHRLQPGKVLLCQSLHITVVLQRAHSSAMFAQFTFLCMLGGSLGTAGSAKSEHPQAQAASTGRNTKCVPIEHMHNNQRIPFGTEVTRAGFQAIAPRTEEGFLIHN